MIKKQEKNRICNLFTTSPTNAKGITLIALVVTIVVFLILAGITINLVLSEGGLFNRARYAENTWEQAVQNDLDSINNLTGELDKYLNSIGTSNGDTTTEDEIIVLKDGTYHTKKGVNSPKIEGTGLIAVYYGENGQTIELTDTSTKEEWNNWYDYTTTDKKWANAITKDSSGNITGYFVWIPRYAYKITSGLYTTTTGEIEIKFLQGTGNIDSEGTEISTTYPEVDEENNAMLDFVVHPAFETDINNGGWDKDLPGFWVAKYPAGFQANTITDNNGTLSEVISNGSDAVVYSTKNYTSYYTGYAVNALNQDLTTKPTMSLPVFKPLTHAYNNISAADGYVLAKEVADITTFYGLNNIDSHQMKNSEWGAVAYLTQSNYGISSETYINNYYANDTKEGLFRATITGVYASDTSSTSTQALGSVYYSSTGINGSSTGNIYGIYDLNGCVWERTSAFISNGNTNLLTYGKALLDATGVTYDEDSETVVAGTGKTNKYLTIYPYSATNDNYAENWATYYELRTTRFGDAVLETSLGNSTINASWNEKYSDFPYVSTPYLVRGGDSNDGNLGGLFSFTRSTGIGSNAGFRVCLTLE